MSDEKPTAGGEVGEKNRRILAKVFGRGLADVAATQSVTISLAAIGVLMDAAREDERAGEQ